MCLRFGSNPRRDFLSTDTPRRNNFPTAKHEYVPAKATGINDQPKHIQQVNCSNTPVIDCGTVKR